MRVDVVADEKRGVLAARDVDEDGDELVDERLEELVLVQRAVERAAGSAVVRAEDDEEPAAGVQAHLLVVGDLLLSDRLRIEDGNRSEEHTSELQSLRHLVCR